MTAAGGNKDTEKISELKKLSTSNLKSAFDTLLSLAQDLANQEKQARDILESQVDLICRYNGDCELSYVNKAFAEFYGKSEQEFIGSSFIDCIPETYWNQLDENIRRFSPEKRVIECERVTIHSDGSRTWIQWSECAFFDSNGQLVNVQAVGRDITKRKMVESENFSVIQKFELLATMLPLGIFQVDTKLNGQYVNQGFVELSSLSSEQAHGKGWQNAVYEKDLDNVIDVIKSAMQTEDDIRTEFRLRTNRDMWLSLRGKPLYEHMKGLDGYLCTIVDITDRKMNEEKLTYMVTHDKLTGLGNRMLFLDTLDSSIARAKRSKSLVVVMFVDLDGFKAVNDTLGHQAGDDLLVEVSKRLVECVRETDAVCRLGGDEFTIVLEGIEDEDAITTLSTRIIERINDPYQLTDKEARVSTSLGICCGQPDEYTSDEFVKYADEAMYEAKTSGKNQFRYHTKS